MDADPEAVVIAAYDAVSRRDLEALERLVDPEVEVIEMYLTHDAALEAAQPH